MLLSLLARAYGARAFVLARLREERGAVDSMTWMLLMGGFALAAGLGVWALRADVGTYFSDIMTRLVGCVTSSGIQRQADQQRQQLGSLRYHMAGGEGEQP